MREIRPIGARQFQLLTMYTAIGAASSVHCIVDGTEDGGPFPRSCRMLVSWTIFGVLYILRSYGPERFVRSPTCARTHSCMTTLLARAH